MLLFFFSAVIHFEHHLKQEVQFSLVFCGSLVTEVSKSNDYSIILKFFVQLHTVSQTSDELFPKPLSSYVGAENTLKICQC